MAGTGPLRALGRDEMANRMEAPAYDGQLLGQGNPMTILEAKLLTECALESEAWVTLLDLETRPSVKRADGHTGYNRRERSEKSSSVSSSIVGYSRAYPVREKPMMPPTPQRAD